MAESLSIYQRLLAVMQDVRSVAKSDRNDHQKFNFRGIDSVINAVGPALRKHGVLVIPQVEDMTYTVEEFGQNRTRMGHVRVRVRYEFIGADGDKVVAVSVGEATDSGDKATAKAMSVAFRTALLQSLCLPTDESDPDSFTYERSPSEAPKKPVKGSKKPVEAQGDAIYQGFIQQFGEATTESQVNAVRDSIVKYREDGGVLAEEQWVALRELYSDSVAKFK